MATGVFDAGSYAVVTWEDEDGTGDGFEVARFSDITVQATGSGTVTMEGSNDGTNWTALNDNAGAAFSLAAGSDEMGVLLEHPFFIRAVVAGGTATVIAVASGNR